MLNFIPDLLKKNFKSSPRTTIVGLVWIGYAIAEMSLTKGISEFGFLAMLTGLGFFLAKDEKKEDDKKQN